MRLCSACLLGMTCRYYGKSSANKRILELSKKEILIPVCPEQLGGLPTPREPSEQRGTEVFMQSGKNVTANFDSGAEETLKLAKLLNITGAILKQQSPSCGSGQIYDGTFSKNLISGDGVTTTLLKKHGITVISENEI